MASFLTKLNGAEVAVNVDDLIAQGEQLKKCVAQAEAKLVAAGTDVQKAKDAQKALDKYRRRLTQLQARVTAMYRHGMDKNQRAQLADVKYAEQEARKAAEGATGQGDETP